MDGRASRLARRRQLFVRLLATSAVLIQVGEVSGQEAPRTPWRLGLRLGLQNHWEEGEPNDTALGAGLSVERHLFAVGSTPIGIELGGAVLFREGELYAPIEAALVGRIETERLVQPFLGLGPVLALDVRGAGTSVGGGGLLAVGSDFFSTREIAFTVKAVYRALGIDGTFEQQVALVVGPTFAVGRQEGSAE